MPNRRAKEAERQQAARELDDMNDGGDMKFEERQNLQHKLYGMGANACGNLACKKRGAGGLGEVLGYEMPLLQCSRCRGQKYCDSQCQKEDWPRHKYFCNSFASTKISVNKLRDKMSLFLQLFMSFPETVSDFILHVRELTPDKRGGHVSIHFSSVQELQKWTKVLEAQRLIEMSRALARTLFYTEEKKIRLQNAIHRTAIHREWITVNPAVRADFEKFFYDSLRWDDDEDILVQFRRAGHGDLGQCGMVLGVSCLVNRADAAQTNILMPFTIRDPPIAPEDQKPRNPTSMEAPMFGDEDSNCSTQ